MHELNVVVQRRCIIMDRATLLDKGIHILNLEQLMWLQTKQNNDRPPIKILSIPWIRHAKTSIFMPKLQKMGKSN